MKEWNDDKSLFSLIRKELYTAVIGDIMDKMGYTHQFLILGGTHHRKSNGHSSFVWRVGTGGFCWHIFHLRRIESGGFYGCNPGGFSGRWRINHDLYCFEPAGGGARSDGRYFQFICPNGR